MTKVTQESRDELASYLNGNAYLLTKEEAQWLKTLSQKELRLSFNELLKEKRQILPFVLEVCNLHHKEMIRCGSGKTGKIIALYTNPESVTIDDIPEFDQDLWSYNKYDLLQIYQKLLIMIKDPAYSKKERDIKDAIRSIMKGNFSSCCQRLIPKMSNKYGSSMMKTVKCDKAIGLEKLLNNPLVRYCDHCYE